MNSWEPSRLPDPRPARVEVRLRIGLADPLNFATRAVGKWHPRHPPLRALAPAHGGTPTGQPLLRRSHNPKGYAQNWLRRVQPPNPSGENPCAARVFWWAVQDLNL